MDTLTSYDTASVPKQNSSQSKANLHLKITTTTMSAEEHVQKASAHDSAGAVDPKVS